MFAVVSCPATSSRNARLTRSRWSSSLAGVRRVTWRPSRLSPGSASSAETSSSRKPNSSRSPSNRCSAGTRWLSSIMLRDWKNSCFAYGTPSSSQMTCDGTGSDRAATRSAGGPPASIASIRSSTICWMRGRSSCTRRVVNSPMTARRATVWSGGSMPISDAPRPRARRSAGVTAGRRAPAGAGRFCGMGNDGSDRSAVNAGADSAARASPSRVTSQVSIPPGSWPVARPGAARRSLNAGGTRNGQARGSGRWTSGGSCIVASPGSG